MAGSLLARITFLVSTLAAGLALFLSLNAGCDLTTAILRAILAACGCAWLGTLLLAPLARALKPEPKGHEAKDENTETPKPSPAASSS